MSLKQPQTFLGAYKQLADELKSGAKPPENPLSFMNSTGIGLRPAVFQHRSPLPHISDKHINELAAVVKQGADLDPITIWWSGKQWICIDGHHRIKAYAAAKQFGYAAPVEIFVGTLEDAVARAAEGNTKNKLPMDKLEKTNAAWRLTVADTSFSKSKVAAQAGVSERTVATMRSSRELLLKQNPEQDLSALTWKQAQRQAKGEALDDINWEDETDKEARELADLLARHIGKRGHKKREALALALGYYDEALPKFLMSHWGEGSDEDDEE